jgi:hypothetical protein
MQVLILPRTSPVVIGGPSARSAEHRFPPNDPPSEEIVTVPCSPDKYRSLQDFPGLSWLAALRLVPAP